MVAGAKVGMMKSTELAVQQGLTLDEIMAIFCSDFRGPACLRTSEGAREISEARTNMLNHGMNPHGWLQECNSEEKLR